MKRFLILFFIFISGVVHAQIYDPVDWTFTQKELPNNEIELQFKAKIEGKWHLYSQDLPLDATATATEFTFSIQDDYQLIGSVIESGVVEKYDPVEEAVLKFFEGEAVFTQKIRKISSDNFKIKGDIYFGVCDDKQCLSPELVEFEFDINESKNADILVNKSVSNPLEEGLGWLFFVRYYLVLLHCLHLVYFR